MAEEKIEVQRDELKLAKIELGSNYTATISLDFVDDSNKTEKINFKFKVHNPTTIEDLKISVKEEQLLGQASKDVYLNLAARMLAVLSVAVDEIYYSDGTGLPNKFNGDFLFLAENIKQIGKFYNELVIPVYNEFINFQNSITKTGFAELKNLLAQTGKN